MKANKTSLLITGMAAAFLSSCVSDSETVEVIFERDKKTIEDFVADTDIVYTRMETVQNTGVVLLFTEDNPEGTVPEAGDIMLVDYTGYFLDGTVFDTSVEQVARDNNMFDPNRNYGPFDVNLGFENVIEGWHIALSQMKEGEEATVLIPSVFAYGRQGRPPLIPGNTVLAFDLSVVEINPEEEEEED